MILTLLNVNENCRSSNPYNRQPLSNDIKDSTLR